MSRERALGDALGLTMARVAGLLYVVGFVTTIVAILLPHSPQANLTGFAFLALAMAAIAALLLALGRRLPAWTYQLAMVAGTVIVSLTLYFNGERLGGPAADNEILYVWIALYAGYFFTHRQMLVQLAVIAGCYAAALVAIHPGQVGFTRWLITVGMVSTAAAVVHALKLHNDRLLARLSEAVRTDPLTGLINRLGFDDSLQRELSQTARSGRPMALIIADIDNFKALNDRLGHQAGDAALKAVGEVALELARAGDTMSRIGGDEFAAILPDTDADGAFHAAERLRAAVGELRVGLDRPLAMSFGVAVGRSPRQTPESIIRSADRALYEAKGLGRDRSVVGVDSRPRGAAPGHEHARVAASRRRPFEPSGSGPTSS
jgi:diguanylate cyclase (GGDEF)-like protein